MLKPPLNMHTLMGRPSKRKGVTPLPVDKREVMDAYLPPERPLGHSLGDWPAGGIQRAQTPPKSGPQAVQKSSPQLEL